MATSSLSSISSRLRSSAPAPSSSSSSQKKHKRDSDHDDDDEEEETNEKKKSKPRSRNVKPRRMQAEEEDDDEKKEDDGDVFVCGDEDCSGKTTVKIQCMNHPYENCLGIVCGECIHTQADGDDVCSHCYDVYIKKEKKEKKKEKKKKEKKESKKKKKEEDEDDDVVVIDDDGHAKKKKKNKEKKKKPKAKSDGSGGGGENGVTTSIKKKITDDKTKRNEKSNPPPTIIYPIETKLYPTFNDWSPRSSSSSSSSSSSLSTPINKVPSSVGGKIFSFLSMAEQSVATGTSLLFRLFAGQASAFTSPMRTIRVSWDEYTHPVCRYYHNPKNFDGSDGPVRFTAQYRKARTSISFPGYTRVIITLGIKPPPPFFASVLLFGSNLLLLLLLLDEKFGELVVTYGNDGVTPAVMLSRHWWLTFPVQPDMDPAPVPQLPDYTPPKNSTCVEYHRYYAVQTGDGLLRRMDDYDEAVEKKAKEANSKKRFKSPGSIDMTTDSAMNWVEDALKPGLRQWYWSGTGAPIPMYSKPTPVTITGDDMWNSTDGFYKPGVVLEDENGKEVDDSVKIPHPLYPEMVTNQSYVGRIRPRKQWHLVPCNDFAPRVTLTPPPHTFSYQLFHIA